MQPLTDKERQMFDSLAAGLLTTQTLMIKTTGVKEGLGEERLARGYEFIAHIVCFCRQNYHFLLK